MRRGELVQDQEMRAGGGWPSPDQVRIEGRFGEQSMLVISFQQKCWCPAWHINPGPW